MSFCNPKSARSKDEDDFIIDNSCSSDYSNDLGFRTHSSCSSSMKWSEDVRKQNEEDWLSIERILYGEESLPEDEKTREEFLCWMKAFPHLRVVGKKIEVPSMRQNHTTYYEEIIAIDPPEGDSFKLLDQELNEKLSIRKSRQLSAKNQLKNDNLEKLLRITSSGMSSGRNKSFNNQKEIRKNERVITVKQNGNGIYGNRIFQNKESEKLSFSASTRQPLLNVKFLFKKPEHLLDDSSKVKSATSKLPLYELRSLDDRHTKYDLSSKSASFHAKNINIIQLQKLPPFNSFEFRGIEGRSIQSAFKPKH